MTHQRTRRAFLKQCLGSLAVSTIAVSDKSLARQSDNTAQLKVKPGRGYHETEHIRAYYQKANF